MKKSALLVLSFCMAFVFALSTSASAGDAAKGEALFKAKCKACHKLDDKAGVGPGLKGVSSRRTEGWLTKWLTDPQKTWEENDAETQALKGWKAGRDKAPKTSMVVKPNPTPEEAADLIAFLKANG